MISTTNHESTIREAIILSARRMVAAIKTVDREQKRIARLFVALEDRGHGVASRLSRSIGIVPQRIYSIQSGIKKIGNTDARRIAKAKIS